MSISLLASVPDEKEIRLFSYLAGATFVLIFLMPFSSLYSICFSSRGVSLYQQSHAEVCGAGASFSEKAAAGLYRFRSAGRSRALSALSLGHPVASGGKVYPFDRTAPGHGFRAAGGGDEQCHGV